MLEVGGTRSESVSLFLIFLKISSAVLILVAGGTRSDALEAGGTRSDP